MKKTRLALIVIIIALVVVLGRPQNATLPTTDTPPVSEPTASIMGCYVARIAKDVYMLHVLAQDGETVNGTLIYNNFQKDSSQGSFKGTYTNDILLGDYVFTSEGMNSVRQVVFKKTNDGFVQGFGPVVVEGNREHFTDMSKVSYQNSPEFRTSPCTKS